MARMNRLPAGVLARGLAVLAWAAGGCASTPPTVPVAARPLGVEVEALRLSAAGYMLDLRYRVVDVDDAGPLFERGTRPFLVEEGSGAQLAVPTTPKLGQLRTTRIQSVKPGRMYSMIFANPGRVVQPGARMVLAVGDKRIEGIVVE